MTFLRLMIALAIALLGLAALAKAGVDSIVLYGHPTHTLLAILGCIALVAGFGWLIDFFDEQNHGPTESPVPTCAAGHRRHSSPDHHFHHSHLD
ncbi:hypothetical protein [Chitinilyticum aquatile]|uniref:hypothetical protein n=1 Tax=Chitinilyticum aquatile TaxID=362520 RepID=UPI0003FC036E|nr:hypothetical protein [Chitinilyticum aquatile]